MCKISRSYKLQIKPNFHKSEEFRYNSQIYKKYLQHFITQLYFSPRKYFSTKGMSKLGNHAQRHAIGILSAHRASVKATSQKTNIPQVKLSISPASIRESKNSSFDYWITVVSQWKNKVVIPAKSHKCLNKALKNGWNLSEYCEITQEKSGAWVCRVFVSKNKIKPLIKRKTLGVDVGIRHSVCRSDNYKGSSLEPVLDKEIEKQRSRHKNKDKKKGTLLSHKKSAMKQVLDREVNRVIGRSKKLDYNVAVENPKVLANLSTGKVGGWAKSYFANRLHVRAAEEGVWVTFVNPAYTSQMCSACGKIDKLSRRSRSEFVCTSCGNTVHADINAARNIALKGQDIAIRNSKIKRL